MSRGMRHTLEERTDDHVDFEDPEFVKWTLEYDVGREASISSPESLLSANILRKQEYLDRVGKVSDKQRQSFKHIRIINGH